MNESCVGVNEGPNNTSSIHTHLHNTTNSWKQSLHV